MDDDILVASAALVIANVLRKRKRQRRNIWTKRWLLRRDEKSAYQNILQELRLEDPDHFRKYLRMNTVTFDVSY